MRLYDGFEQGPIRPPSEQFSLKLRVSRNCPWNQCTFCPVYKGQRFSLRSADDLKRDIDCIARSVEHIKEGGQATDYSPLPESNCDAVAAAHSWVLHGMKDVFLQDANSLHMNPADLLEVLLYLRQTFPSIRRITSYARSHTLSKIQDEMLLRLREAGLSRIHIGFESGSDAVLRRVKKGATQAIHIKAGQKVKRAGIELSVYIMPGLGGRDLSTDHATQSAVAVNAVNPDFIRLRTLFVMPGIKLFEEMQQGLFQPLSEVGKVREVGIFVQSLEGIASQLKSNDHSLNLLHEVDGCLPDDKDQILAAIQFFHELDAEDQALFILGKRMGVFRSLKDLGSPTLRGHVEAVACKLHVTQDNVDSIAQHFVRL